MPLTPEQIRTVRMYVRHARQWREVGFPAIAATCLDWAAYHRLAAVNTTTTHTEG